MVPSLSQRANSLVRRHFTYPRGRQGAPIRAGSKPDISSGCCSITVSIQPHNQLSEKLGSATSKMRHGEEPDLGLTSDSRGNEEEHIPTSSACRASVCVPAYNRPDTIERLIKSFLWQSNTDAELVISDDRSEERRVGNEC